MTKRRRAIATVTANLDIIAAEASTKYGGQVMMKGTEALPFSYIPTGVFTVDLATLGGYPDGHSGLIWGWAGSSKTSLMIKTMAEAQKKYPHLSVVYVDAETHYNEEWFKKLGVDTDRLKLIQNLGLAESYADLMDATARTGEVSLMVLDSIAALIPLDEVQKSAEDEVRMAARARVVNRMCSSLLVARQEMVRAGKHPCTTIMINQNREKIGGFQTFGTPTTQGGGRAKDFLSMLSIEMKKGQPNEVTDPRNSIKTVMSTSYAFNLKKPKAGCSFLKGDYLLVTSESHPRLPQGSIDESATVMVYAKKLGMTGGGGKKQTFVMFPDKFYEPQGKELPAAAKMGIDLEQNPEIFSLTKAVIVAIVRMQNGKNALPHDGYLMGHTADEILPIIEKLIPDDE